MSESRVWSRKGGLASWDYRFVKYDPEVLNNPDTRKQWIIDVVRTMLDILKPFATPFKVEVGTVSKGEEAFIINSKDPEYREKLIRYLNDTNDVTDVNIFLTLHCYDVDENLNVKEISFGLGGRLYLFIELDEKGELTSSPIWKEYDPVWLSFIIDVNIYAPLVEETAQRQKTARINGPILKDFLERLESHLSIEQTNVDGPWYLLSYLEKL